MVSTSTIEATTVTADNIGLKVVQITQAAYDALSPPDASTCYAIVG